MMVPRLIAMLGGLASLAAAAMPGIAHAAGGGGTLPQLDVSTFPSQIFWLLVTFGLLYLLMARVVIPRIAEVLEERQERIADDLDAAERQKQEAEAIREEYEKALAGARSEAQASTKKVADEIAAANAKAEADAGRKVAEQVQAAESRITAARAEALDNVRGVASEVAAAAVDKLIGVKTAAGDVDKAVAAAMEGRS